MVCTDGVSEVCTPPITAPRTSVLVTAMTPSPSPAVIRNNPSSLPTTALLDIPKLAIPGSHGTALSVIPIDCGVSTTGVSSGASFATASPSGS